MTVALTIDKEATDRFVDVGGISIHYNEAGEGPPLICTHGGGPGANAWDNTKYAFASLAENFHVILMDLPGFGESQKLVSREGVPMDLFCARLQRDFLDTLGIERTHLYGSSAFSATALRFGIEFPDRVGKIIIQAYSPAPEGERTPGLQSLTTFAQNPTLENMELMASFFTPRPEFRTPEMVQSRFNYAMTPGHLESRKEFSGGANSKLEKEVAKLTTETLIVWGVNDGMIHSEDVISALRLIPNSQAHVWGGDSGHFVATEHAVEFARIAAAFCLS